MEKLSGWTDTEGNQQWCHLAECWVRIGVSAMMRLTPAFMTFDPSVHQLQLRRCTMNFWPGIMKINSEILQSESEFLRFDSAIFWSVVISATDRRWNLSPWHSANFEILLCGTIQAELEILPYGILHKCALLSNPFIRCSKNNVCNMCPSDHTAQPYAEQCFISTEDSDKIPGHDESQWWELCTEHGFTGAVQIIRMPVCTVCLSNENSQRNITVLVQHKQILHDASECWKPYAKHSFTCTSPTMPICTMRPNCESPMRNIDVLVQSPYRKCLSLNNAFEW